MLYIYIYIYDHYNSFSLTVCNKNAETCLLLPSSAFFPSQKSIYKILVYLKIKKGPRVSRKFLLLDISFFLKFQGGDNFFRTKLSHFDLVHECFAGVTNNLQLYKQPMFHWKMTFVLIIWNLESTWYKIISVGTRFAAQAQDVWDLGLVSLVQ